MSELKKHQPPMTIDEQVENMKSIGLIVDDEENFTGEEYHAELLNDIKEEIARNVKAPFVRNFRENYEGGSLPI